MQTAAKIGIEIGAAFSGSFKNVFGQANGEIGKIGSEIKKLEGRQKELNATIAEQQKLGAKGSPLKAMYATAEIDQITGKIIKLRQEQEKLMAAQTGKNKAKSQIGSAAMGLGAVTAAAFTLGAPIVQAASFEKAMLGVAKQVEGARDESGKLTNVYYDMAKQVQMLGREIPLATNDLAAMVAAGARMGVAKDELIGFTKTAAMMASAFELPAGELADQMGKIANLYKIPIPNINGLADTINYLDDNAISKGGDIIDYLTRVGGVASSVKITGQEMAALGSTLLTLGERTETASTATNAIFQKFAAADKGTKKFKEAMKEIGLSTAEVQKGMQVDAQGTLLKVLDAIKTLPDDKRIGVMTELVGLEHSDTLAKLASNTEEYRKQIEMVNSEKAKGSMGREFAAQLATTNAQWTIAKNRIEEVSVNLGSVLLPAVNSVLGGFVTLTSGVADFVANNKTLVSVIGTAIATIGGIFAACKLAALGVGLITYAFYALQTAVMTNPIGLALKALVVAGVLLWQNWDAIKDGLVAIWNVIRGTAIAAFESIKSAVGAVIGWLAQKTAWIFETVDKVKAAAGSLGDGIGGAWSGAKSLVGLGPDKPAASTPAAAAAAGATPLAAVPAGAAGGNTTHTNITAPITINGATDPAATAKAVNEALKRREREAAAAKRGQMTDALGN